YPGQTHPVVQLGNELAGLAMTAGSPFSVRGALGATGGRLPPSNVTNLALERAQRRADALARAKRQGYADEPFYLTPVRGRQPTEFPEGEYFKRPKDANPRGYEYRLDLSNALDLSGDRVKNKDMARIISALNEIHPERAEHWVSTWAPAHIKDPT